MVKKLSWGLLGLGIINLVACSESSDAINVKTEISADEVETFDDMSNCTTKREGESVYVKDDGITYVCQSGTWEEEKTEDKSSKSKSTNFETEDDLPNCTEKREGVIAYVEENDLSYICQDGVWEENNSETGSETDDEEDETSSSSKGTAKSSASTKPGSSATTTSSTSTVTSSTSTPTSSGSASTSSASTTTSSASTTTMSSESTTTSSASTTTTSSESTTTSSTSPTTSSSTSNLITCAVDRDEIYLGDSFSFSVSFNGRTCFSSSISGDGAPGYITGCASPINIVPTTTGTHEYTYEAEGYNSSGLIESASCTQVVSVTDNSDTWGRTSIELVYYGEAVTMEPGTIYTITYSRPDGSSGGQLVCNGSGGSISCNGGNPIQVSQYGSSAIGRPDSCTEVKAFGTFSCSYTW